MLCLCPLLSGPIHFPIDGRKSDGETERDKIGKTHKRFMIESSCRDLHKYMMSIQVNIRNTYKIHPFKCTGSVHVLQ